MSLYVERGLECHPKKRVWRLPAWSENVALFAAFLSVAFLLVLSATTFATSVKAVSENRVQQVHDACEAKVRELTNDRV